MERGNVPIDRWLDQAVSGIRFGPDRAAVRAELEAHMEDKAADLQRIFPDISREETEERTLSEMGDPAEIGKKLARIHKPWLGWLWRASGVLLALALEPVPHILILDEPLSGVDIEGEHQLLEMLDELRTQYDLSIFLSTHDFATLGQFADKVILLNKRMLRAGPPDEVLSSPEFYDTFHLRMGRGGER